ncbi:MAG: flagellar filament capping protein FliD [Anaerolineales bacterium]|nr:flagellar filament capping protein FliD [Anaerolineales bacterium]
MATITALDSYFTTLISSLMEIERQPLARMTTQRDTFNVKRGAYSDLNTKLDSLQDAVKALRSSTATTALTAGRSTTITPADSNTSVLTATASKSAIAGQYDLSVTNLAKAQRQASAVQASVDQALGKTGTFWLGGTGTADVSLTATTSVTGAAASAHASGQKELGSSTYTVETRDNNGVLEFRLKDVDGKVVSISNGDDSYTTAWQKVTTGDFDTGRGVTLSLDASGTAGSTTFDYTAAGVEIAIEAEDTLMNIATKINAADQPVGRDVAASIVGKQLILTAAHTGTAHTMIYSDAVGLGFSGGNLQTAEDATFTVNGIAFTRSSNTGLTDVINGVTLNFTADAEGHSATLDVKSDMSAARTAVETFVKQFNDIQIYLQAKTSVSAVNNGQTLTYTRGTLADDYAFSNLRSELFSTFMTSSTNSGEYSNLRNIGLTINDSLQATITDADKLDAALENNFDDVVALLDDMMAKFDTQLERFTGSSTGYLNQAMESIDRQISELNDDISSTETRLEEKQTSLIDQFGAMQAQLLALSYMQQSWSSIYNSSMNLYG